MIRYGLAKLSQYNGLVTYHTELPLEGVDRGELVDFLRSAGQNGWQLCASYPTAQVGIGRMNAEGELVVCKDSADEISLIFSRAE